jgi:hypothetical protein
MDLPKSRCKVISKVGVGLIEAGQPSDHDVVESRVRVLQGGFRDGGFQSPPDAIANNRSPQLPGHGKAEPGSRLALLRACLALKQEGRCRPAAAASNPLELSALLQCRDAHRRSPSEHA